MAAHTAAEADAFLASIEQSMQVDEDEAPAPEPNRVVTAGDDVTADVTRAAMTVRLGVGVHQDERTGEAVVASRAGVLRQHGKQGNRWRVDGSVRRYVPVAEDAVVGTVVGRSGQSYRVDVGASAPALLDTLAFDGATKRNRPHLDVGSLLYARVEVTRKDMDTQLTCKAPDGAPRRDWVSGEALFGELKEGHVFGVSTGLARALLGTEGGGAGAGAGGAAPPTGPESVLGVLGGRLAFEIAVGANGKVWVDSARPAHTVLVANAITSSEHCATAEACEAMVRVLVGTVTGEGGR